MNQEQLLKIIQKMLAIKQTGLVYSKDVFDIERFTVLQKLLEEMMNFSSCLTQSEMTELLRPITTYATPLIDTRAFILNDAQEVLLVKDRRDETRALPGDFGEVGLSSTENILVEVKEETGYDAKVDRLLAVFDSNKHQL